MATGAVLGLPGIRSEVAATLRNVRKSNTGLAYLEGGRVIVGADSRDPLNTGYVHTLRPGMLMGKNTSSGKWAPSVIGLTGEAVDDTETALTVAEAVGDELERRIGASGTFTLTGPPGAAGVVRSLTVTYSAIAAASGGNRVITFTALGVNEVQTLTFNAAATAGNYQFRVPLADGTMEVTSLIAWNGTDATLLSNINTALDAVTGVAGGIVATGAAPDTALTFTFSGTGYSGNSYNLIEVVIYPTTPVSYTTARTTAGVDGDFVTASIIGDTDGTQTPRALIDDGDGIKCTDDNGTSLDVPWATPLVGGHLDSSQIINWPSDASLVSWIKDSLNNRSGSAFIFDDAY